MSFGPVRLPPPTCSTLGRPRHTEGLGGWCGLPRGARGEAAAEPGATIQKKRGGGPPPVVQRNPDPEKAHHHSIATTNSFTARRRGFTLIEVIVVVIVLGLLAGIVGPAIVERLSEAKSGTAKTQLEILVSALDTYRIDAGSYPTTEQGLDALRTLPTRAPIPLTWRGPYLRKDIPNDPWGRPYLYKNPGVRNATSFDLWSLGRDGKPEGKGEDADVIGQ